MRTILMFFISLFPLPAFATTIDDKVVDAKKNVADAVEDEDELVPLGRMTAPTGVVVVLLSFTGLPKSSANDAINIISQAIEAAGVPMTLTPSAASQKLDEWFGKGDLEACKKNKECVLKLGAKLRVQVIVGINISKIFNNVSIVVKAINIPEGKVLATFEFMTKKEDAFMPSIFKAFAERLHTAMQAEAPKKDPVPFASLVPSDATSDQPKVEPKKDLPALVIKPERVFQTPPSEIVTAAPQSKTLSIVGYTVAGAGVLTVGLGAYFGIQARANYNGAKATTNFDEFNRLKQSSKGSIGNADLCYGIGTAAMVLGIGAVILDNTVLNTPAQSMSIAVSGNGVSVAGTW